MSVMKEGSCGSLFFVEIRDCDGGVKIDIMPL